MNWLVLTTDQLSSSGQFSQVPLHSSHFRKTKRRWKTEFILNSSKIEPSSRRCAATSIGQEMETKKCVFGPCRSQGVRKKTFNWTVVIPETRNRRAWYGTHTHKPDGLWNNSAEMMMLHLRESGHPIFRATSALDRGSFKSRGGGGGKLSIHYNSDSMTAELLFRMIISVKQLSVCGPISDWCEELAQQISDHSFYSSGRPVANMNDESESHISPNVMSILTNPHSTNVPVQTKDSKIFQRTFEWEKLGMMLVLWERFLLDNISWQSMTWIWLDLNMLDHAENGRQDGFEESRKIGTELEVKVTYHLDQCGIEIKVDSTKNHGSQSLDCDQQGNEQIRWRTSWREWEICSLRRSAHRYGATRCDKTEETINSTITFTLCTDRSTEVERHSCRPHRRQRILVIQCLKDNDPNSPTSRSSSRNRWSNGLGYIATYAVSRLRERPEMDEWWVVRSTA